MSEGQGLQEIGRRRGVRRAKKKKKPMGKVLEETKEIVFSVTYRKSSFGMTS